MARALPEPLERLVRSPSLRLRLTVWTVFVALIIQLILATVVFFYQRRDLDSVLDRRMLVRADQIRERLLQLDADPDSATLDAITRESMKFAVLESSVAALYRTDGARLVATSDAAPEFSQLAPLLQDDEPRPRRLPLPLFPAAEDSDGLARALVRPFVNARDEERLLFLAASDDWFRTMLRSATRPLLYLIPLGLIGTGLAAWLISGLAIAPLRELREMAHSFEPETIREEMSTPQTSAELAAFQKDLFEVRARLQQAFRSQDRLIANLSHELKTPVAVLLVEASTLRASTLTPEVREFVASVQQEMRGLSKTLETFLLLSRTQGGQRPAAAGRCELNEITLDAVRNASRAARERGVELRTILPEGSRQTSVLGDHEMLRALIEHLVRSAIASSPRGDTVVITVSAGERTCTVAVRDRGAPMSLAALATVFDWFTDSSTECEDRRNPGLAVAKAIAEIHGGQVTASNGDGGGCDFMVELPLADEAAPPKRS